ncbi:glycosyltransferase [Pradoshia sp.]
MKVKIALICTEKLPVPSIRGGAIQVLIDGVLPYLNHFNEVTVYSVDDPILQNKEMKDGIEYIRAPRDGYVENIYTELAKKAVKGETYDLIHVFNRPLDVLTYKLAMPKSRFVLSLHNEMFTEKKITTKAAQAVIDSVEKIMTVSEFIAKTITDRFPSAKGKVQPVYSGLDLTKYTPIWDKDIQEKRTALRKQYKVNDKKVILFVGRLSKVKGPEILLEAMKSVLKAEPNAVIVIVGSRWFSDERIDSYGRMLRDLADSLGKNKVIFTGFVPPSEIPSLYLLGDLFVCSSQWEEPLARVHYEAMGAGLPIITTNRGGNAEVVHHGVNGIVLDDYQNPQTFSDAIIDLLSDAHKASSLSMEGRKYAEKNFGFKQVEKRLSKLYAAAMETEKAPLVSQRKVERMIKAVEQMKMNNKEKERKRKLEEKKRAKERRNRNKKKQEDDKK